MRKAKVMIPIASLLVLLMAAGAYAFCGMGYGRGGGLGAIWKELTPEQQKQIDAAKLDFLKKHGDVVAQIEKKKVELIELAGKEKPDEQAIAKKREEIWALKDADLKDARALKTKVRSLLTPEQRKEVGPFGPRLGHPFRCGYGMGMGGGCGMGGGYGGMGRGGMGMGRGGMGMGGY